MFRLDIILAGISLKPLLIIIAGSHSIDCFFISATKKSPMTTSNTMRFLNFISNLRAEFLKKLMKVTKIMKVCDMLSRREYKVTVYFYENKPHTRLASLVICLAGEELITNELSRGRDKKYIQLTFANFCDFSF
jgi:hypothetical protein